MENKQITKRGLSGWMEDFISGLAKKAEVNEPTDKKEEEVVEAEVNIGDLDKVVWKDETFRVAFDDKGANVINEFGNTVTSVPGAKSVEEVDHKLNANEIIASEENNEEEELANELDKLALSLGEEDIPTEDEVTAGAEDEACNTEDEKSEVKESAVEDEILEGEDEVMNVIASGFEELEATIAALEQRLSSMEQQYARAPQFPELGSISLDDEVKHYTETADATSQEINKEHGVDITSPAGRVELSQQVSSEVEQIVTEDAPISNETPVTEDAPVTEEVTVDEAPVEETVEEEDEDKEDAQVEKLSGVAEKIFQQAICPETGEELVKSTTAGNFLGVYSPNGGTEYAVNLTTGEIFKHKK